MNLFILLGALCAAHDSGHALPPQGQPMSWRAARPEPPPSAGKRETGSPALERDAVMDQPQEGARSELVVEFDGGFVRQLKLSQGGAATPASAVLARQLICTDLCDAGLGGAACGSGCNSNAFMPFASQPENNSVAVAGSPRSSVCPVLCKNGLGDPLCKCAEGMDITAWDPPAVCSAFCHAATPYRVGGCDSCPSGALPPPQASFVLMPQPLPSDVWIQWCGYQCRRGDGGAACNCDMAPLMLQV